MRWFGLVDGMYVDEAGCWAHSAERGKAEAALQLVGWQSAGGLLPVCPRLRRVAV